VERRTSVGGAISQGNGSDDATLNQFDVAGEEQLFRALKRFWHPVMYAAELGDTPAPATLLDEQIVLVRLEGAVRCFKDLCVHRGTALSLGHVEDGGLRCAYHGWMYNADGRCIQIPARFGSNIPSRAKLTTYRCQERDGLIWVCLDPDPYYPLPEFTEWDKPGFKVATIPAYDWNCSATRRVENYVDFAHFPWIHDGILASRDHPEVPDHPVWREGAELRFEGVRQEPPGTSKPGIGGETAVGSKTEYRLFMPLTIWLHQIYDDGREFIAFMAACPVSRKRARSFTFNARNYDLDGDDQPHIEFQELIVGQDRPVSESQRPEELPMDLSAELHIRGVDKVSIEYRKWLVELKELEPSARAGTPV
jgi:phenylpropionate dioxygenase-like ring-hydroxylating dioxygenase large terminal subunit